MAKTVDSYRFLDGIARQAMKHWALLGRPREIPWTPLAKPLSQCTVSLLSSAGVALITDQPFDQGIERRDPWFSDPSYRLLPRTASAGNVRVYHLHINRAFAEEDLNCVMPIEQLNELEALGEVGRSAHSHYSYMGYSLRPEALLQHSVPDIIHRLREEQVDAVVLVPVWPVCCWSVGLVQREIEAAGFSTISLSMIPELTASVGVPRIAAIEHPFGLTLGSPGDAARQLEVLRGTLRALEEISQPVGVVHLPFEWNSGDKLNIHPPEPPPIARYLRRHPWHFQKFLHRTPPPAPAFPGGHARGNAGSGGKDDDDEHP